MPGTCTEPFEVAVLDDAESDRLWVVDALRDEAVSVTGVSKIPELGELPNTKKAFKLFILDVMIGDKNRIRESVAFVHKHFPDAAVIILTNHADQTARVVGGRHSVPVFEKTALQSHEDLRREILSWYEKVGRLEALPEGLADRWSLSGTERSASGGLAAEETGKGGEAGSSARSELTEGPEIETILSMSGHVLEVRDDGVVAQVWADGAATDDERTQTLLFPLRSFRAPKRLRPGTPLRYRVYWEGTRRIHDVSVIEDDADWGETPALTGEQLRILDAIGEQVDRESRGQPDAQE